MSKLTPDEQKRRHPRVKPEPSSSALILFENRASGAITFIRSVVIDESSDGAGLLLDSTYLTDFKTELVVRVGDHEPRHSRVVWNKPIGLSALRAGIEFFD